MWRDAIPNIDPYYNQLRVGLIVAHHYLDTLVYRDPEDFKIIERHGKLGFPEI